MNPNEYDKHGKSMASVRAGNVIGGGDWAKDRIVPDCIRAIESGKPILIRNRNAVRPWQHVLEPLRGYMILAQKMWNHPTEFCEGWNFGPNLDSVIPVWKVASKIVEIYGKGELIDKTDLNAPHEANLLMLDISKASKRLGWIPILEVENSIRMTVEWYKQYNRMDVYDLCKKQLMEYSR